MSTAESGLQPEHKVDFVLVLLKGADRAHEINIFDSIPVADFLSRQAYPPGQEFLYDCLLEHTGFFPPLRKCRQFCVRVREDFDEVGLFGAGWSSMAYAGRLSVGGMKPSSDSARMMPRNRKLLLKPNVYCRAPSLIGSSILRSTSFLI